MSLFILFGLTILPLSVWSQPVPIFDSHSHYSASDARVIDPAQIEQLYQKNNILGAVITSTPTHYVEKLAKQQSKLIVPFLSAYESAKDKPNWMHDMRHVKRMRAQLDAYPYVGIGELHIFKKDVHSPVLKAFVELAQQRHLVLMIHGDVEIIDRIFTLNPNAKIIWAHLGTIPHPYFLNKVLTRHPRGLWLDTSVRDAEFVDAQGQIKALWKHFFIRNQNRLLAAIDTYSSNRWQHINKATASIRLWLNQLPEDVRHKIAYQNGLRLFNLNLPDALQRSHERALKTVKPIKNH